MVEKWFKENDEEKEDNGQADVSNWRDIIYISSSWRKTLGVKKDGTVLVTEDDYGDHGENNVKSFKLFADVDELQKSIAEHEEFAKKEAEKKICEKKQAIYNNTILVINAEFEKELKPHIEKIAAKYLEQRQYLINARDSKIQGIRAKKSSLEEEKKKLERRRSIVGLFKEKAKKELTDQIDAISTQILSLPTEQSVFQEYQPQIDAIDINEKKECQQVQYTIRAKYPIPSFEEFQIN